MPVARVERESLHSQYSVAATCGEVDFAVKHVGLLAATCQLKAGEAVAVFDSHPPLHIGQVDDKGQAIVSNIVPALVGWVELNESQRRNIDRVLADLRVLMPRRALSGWDLITYYVAVPHMIEVPGEVPGAVKHYRFSCAGLVLYCYDEGAGIPLVDLSRLPMVSFDELTKIWTILADMPPKIRSRVGLPDESPQQVLLPGYILHALDREDVSAAYVPCSDDKCYPRIGTPSGGAPSSMGGSCTRT